MFVLTGAIKLFREQHGARTFRHHTMLAHESVRQVDHLELANEIRTVWRSAAFSSPSGLPYLQTLYEEDIVPTSRKLSEERLPNSFEHLKPFIGEVISRITQTGDPVIIVNSDQDMRKEDVDFDRRPVWRVLVGGAKLSRGFTVEGLTISYYRRRTGQADTLMQMGRWFGFRKGYQDLVRLYIDRRVQAGQKTIDLYGAFGAIMRAEELFREELSRYAELVNGKPQIRPAEVPPLVTQHLPWLRPTARNKMFNARLDVRRLPEIEPVAYPEDPIDIQYNYRVVIPLVVRADAQAEFSSPKPTDYSSFTARYGVVSHDEFLMRLEQLRWNYSDHFAPDLAFLKEASGSIDDWVVLVPILGTGAIHTIPEYGSLSVSHRKRSRGPLFQNISDPKHRDAARRIAGVPLKQVYPDHVADSLHGDRRGAVIIYPLTEREIKKSDVAIEIPSNSCIIAVRIVVPNSTRRPDRPYVGFKVQLKNRENEIIVTDPDVMPT